MGTGSRDKDKAGGGGTAAQDQVRREGELQRELMQGIPHCGLQECPKERRWRQVPSWSKEDQPRKNTKVSARASSSEESDEGLS